MPTQQQRSIGALLLCILLGFLGAPESRAQTPDVAIPITVSTDAGGSQELTVGIDPAATTGIDPALGEVEQPPPPPSAIFDARLVDTHLDGVSGFGEGLLVDIRPGTAGSGESRTYEIAVQRGEGAASITYAWTLPAGVTGTLEDRFGAGIIGPVQMEGSGSVTTTDDVEVLIALTYGGGGGTSPPATQADAAVTDEETDVVIDVLANDNDPQGLDPTSVAVDQGPDHGVATPTASGSITYTPTPNFFGVDRFTYTVADNAGTPSAPTSVQVAVDNVPDAADPPGLETTSVIVDPSVGSSFASSLGGTGLTLRLNDVQSGGVAQATFAPGPLPSGTSSKFVPEDVFDNVSSYRWRLQLAGASATNYEVEFDLADPDVLGVTDPSSVVVVQDVGENGDYRFVSSQVDDGGTPGNASDDSIIASPTSPGGLFRFASDSSPLPVELTSFAAGLRGGAVDLTWTTASETANRGFEVQRRPAAVSSRFETVGFVDGAGTTDQPQTYRFRDGPLPFAADSIAYRLRQVDVDGAVTEVGRVTVALPIPESALEAPFPNPARTAVTIRYASSADRPADLHVYNVLGQRVASLLPETRGPGRVETTLDVSTWPNGLYFVRLSVGDTVQTRRLLVVR